MVKLGSFCKKRVARLTPIAVEYLQDVQCRLRERGERVRSEKKKVTSKPRWRGESERLRAVGTPADSAAGLPKADWCPTEAETTQVWPDVNER